MKLGILTSTHIMKTQLGPSEKKYVILSIPVPSMLTTPEWMLT